MGLGLFAAFVPAVHMELAPLFLAAFALPLADTAWVIIRRIFARTLPWQGGDRRHLHYRLQDAGWGGRSILVLFVISSIFLALAGKVVMVQEFSVAVMGGAFLGVCGLVIALPLLAKRQMGTLDKGMADNL